MKYKEELGRAIYLLHNYGSVHQCDCDSGFCCSGELGSFVKKHWKLLCDYQESNRPNDVFKAVRS